MAEAVSKTYADASPPALSDVSFRIGGGEVVALLGHNGAGKSTLFEIVCGLQRPDSGAAKLSVAPSEFGWCPQREIIDWSLTVRQNVEMGLAFRRVSPRGVRALAEEVCKVVGLERFLDRQAETLSGGELRRCQIARAIAGRPRLMVLDEPTTGLDPDAVAQVFDFLRDSARQGSTVLVSTHDTSRFAGHCNRVLALSAGCLLAQSTSAGLRGPGRRVERPMGRLPAPHPAGLDHVRTPIARGHIPMSTHQAPPLARRFARPLIAGRFHWLSLWNWRQVYYGRVIEPIAYLLFLAAGIGGAAASGNNHSLGPYLAFVVRVCSGCSPSTPGPLPSQTSPMTESGACSPSTPCTEASPLGYLSSIVTILGTVFLGQLALLLVLAAALGGLADVSALHLSSTVLTALHR